MRRIFLVLALVVALSACGDALLSSSSSEGRSGVSSEKPSIERRRQGLERPAPEGDVLGEEEERLHVIVLDSSEAKSGASVTGLASEHGVEMERVFRTALRGGVARLTPEKATHLKNDTRVRRVAPDRMVWAMEVSGTNDGAKSPSRLASGSGGTQFFPPWGLDRVDQREGLDSTYVYERRASEVDVYVVDSGIYAGHEEFGGRASGGADFVDGTAVDCNGHGTHVAGTVGGARYGVAKGARLVPVRVLGCDGSGRGSDIIAALDWILQNAEGPSVVNMSLGAEMADGVLPSEDPINEAVRAVTSAGIPVVVAAGNDAENACNYSPASAASAVTVAAANKSDGYAYFSNYGSCVDLFAPGVDVKSAYIGGSTATAALQGTSMASPHVAGVAALLLAGQPNLTAGEVHGILVEEATQHAVYDPLTANNHMLYALRGVASLQVETSQYWKYQSVELVWAGLGSEKVRLFQDGTPLGETPNDGRTSITLGWETSGTHQFRVCTPDESFCTPEQSVTL